MALPNILYLHSHDTGRYVEPYGYGIPMPSMQRLAAEGVVFRQAFCAASSCSASRASLLTGQHAHTNGMLGLAHRGWKLNDYRHHIVHTLHGAGYGSMLIGEQHVSKRPDAIGYDDVVEISTTRVSDVAPRTNDALRLMSGKPFFLSVGFFETHRSFFPAVAGSENWARPPANLPDTAAMRADMAAFAESARSLDRGIGEVLLALETYGLADDTLVICTTDHGAAFPGGKATLTDRGIGVYLILRGPGGFSGGRALDALVSQIDLFPTICELAGIETPPWVQGRSLVPLVDGRADEVQDAIYAGGTYHAAYEPQRTIRTRDWKYVRRFEPRTAPVLANTDDSPAKELWIERGWPAWMLEEEQLYDLVLDPNEASNVIGRAANAPVADELRTRLEDWMRETGDPLLDGPVLPPPGAEFNDPDDRSADDPVHVQPATW